MDQTDAESRFAINNLWLVIPFVLILIPTTCFMIYMGFTELQHFGRIKFSMEPIVYTGLGLDDAAAPAVPPSFNVTLRAKSTYSWVMFCSRRQAEVEVAYAGMTIAMAEVEPFCVDAKGEKVIKATASPGWLALPSFLQERMESDPRHGGVQVEVDFGFRNEDQAHPENEELWWVRCHTTLNADQPSPCTSYYIRGC